MSRSSSNEIVQGYIEEVRTYIPSLTRGLESLRETPDQTEILEEVHRLVHTIKGASSMVGIHGLSHIAFQMEDVLDDIIAGKISFTENTFKAMSETVSQFQMYCIHLLEDGVNARDMLRKTVLSFRRIRNLPPEEDNRALQKLLDIVPEHEGGKESEKTTPESKEKSKVSSHPPDDDKMLLALLESSDEPVIDPEDMFGAMEMSEDSVHTGILSEQESQLPDDDMLLEFLESNQEIAKEETILPEIETTETSSFDSKLSLETGEFASDKFPSESVQNSDLNQKSISEIPQELLESFYEEAEEHLQDLGRSLNILESQITKPVAISLSQREIIRQVRRSVHTLKGASAIIGLPNVSSYAHSLEDLLDWLYETAKEISPDIIALLSDSSHLLERIVAAPQSPQTAKVQILKAQYKEVMASEPMKSYVGEESDMLWSDSARRACTPDTAEKKGLKSHGLHVVSQSDSELPQISDSSELVQVSDLNQQQDTELEENAPKSSVPFYQSRTLRVGMERIDELVNLVGELIIALSGFDQKMDMFMNSVNELELSRDRLRDIAREMEVSYEVKGLEHQATGTKAEAVSWIRGHQIVTSSDSHAEATEQGNTGAISVVPPPEHGNEDFKDFDSLELDRYSELNLIIRTLNESVIDVGAINTNLVNLFSEFDGRLTRQRVLLSELQGKMMRVRMTPMQIITNKLRRTVHNISNVLGKKIRLVIEGEDIELDRAVWEKITDPLMHLLRNSADHGIEHPELRQALGKPPLGTIHLSASREGNQVVIRISDDGAGLNYPAIRETIRKIRPTEKPDDMSEEELAAFIFHPGFSTRGKISEVSGRGVGMDVVKQNIQELKGTIRIASWKDKGSRFTIRIPLTLAVIRALLFTVRREVFALALNEIKEIVRVAPEHITGKIEQVVRLGDEVLPLYFLSKFLHAGRREMEDPEEAGSSLRLEPISEQQRPVVLVVETDERRVALVIDNLVGQREIVIKSTGSHLRYVKGISGVTIMGDGSVVPILDLEELLRTEAAEPDTTMPAQLSGTKKTLQIMVVDDSVSIRQVVSRLFGEQGWHVQTAKDGIDALEKLREFRPNLIVLDIEMPRMNGYEFLSALRVQPAYQNIPVVMLTSRTTSKHRDKAIALGAKGFIAKPYNDDDFVNLVLRLTGEN